MKMIRNSLASVAAAALLLLPSGAVAQTDAFTYQGRLTANGTAASGNYDLTFQLFDAGTNGSQLGLTSTNADQAVSNGLFVVTLNFGANVFYGADRWLQIGVRTNGIAGAFVPLNPRQPLTPT